MHTHLASLSTSRNKPEVMFIEIGSYEAKTKLPELPREVQAGQCFTITLRGKPVASLVPCTSATDHHAAVN